MVVAAAAASAVALVCELILWGGGAGMSNGVASTCASAACGAAWFVCGIGDAYAWRRSVSLLKAYHGYRGDDAATAQTAIYLAIAASVLCLATTRMDSIGAVVATCVFVPTALALLPQGRPVLGNRDAGSWAGATGREATGRETTGREATGREAAGEEDAEDARHASALGLPAEDGAGMSDGLVSDSARTGKASDSEHAVGTPDIAPAEDASDAGSMPGPTLVPPSERAEHFNDLAVRFGLSEREHDLLFLLADGLNAQQIAERAFVSRNTAKTHMAHIYAKFGIHSRAELDRILSTRG